jgi:hypothetical protein
MNIRRSFPRLGPLIVSTLAVTAAAVIPPAPASGSTTINVSCGLSFLYPSGNASSVVATAFVNCTGAASSINLWMDLRRNGLIVGSGFGAGTFGASAGASAACVPGNYVATATASILYPVGNIPASDYFSGQSATVYISCTVPFAVNNPGSRSTFYLDRYRCR